MLCKSHAKPQFELTWVRVIKILLCPTGAEFSLGPSPFRALSSNTALGTAAVTNIAGMAETAREAYMTYIARKI